MRKRGLAWDDWYQKLVVESYKSGMYVSEIMKLPQIAKLSPKAYMIRSILRANGIKPSWNRKKQRPELWEPEFVGRIIDLRNAGKSVRVIRESLKENFPDIEISKSTIVRIIDANSHLVRYKPPRRRAVWRKEIANKIVELYKNGTLINDIKDSQFLKDYKPSGNVIREILKAHGVKLTWRKGELRRWPVEVRERIVEMYRSGMDFKTILNDESLQPYSPTHYAIRKILKLYGVKTQREARYKKPITKERFKQYTGGKLRPEEEAAIHKHLALYRESREEMFRRMRMHLARDLPEAGEHGDRIRTVKLNAKRLREFIAWGMQNLKDEFTKKRILLTGMEYGKAVLYLHTSLRKKDESRFEHAWARIENVAAELACIYSEVLGEPAEAFKLRAIG